MSTKSVPKRRITTALISGITYSGKSTATYSYTYDAVGNITAVYKNGTLQASYVYDDLNQLTRENNVTAGKTWVYTYDRRGNILSRKTYAYTTGTLGTAQDTDTYEYFEQSSEYLWGDGLLRYDGTDYNVYDAIGNPLSYNNGSAYTFSWQNGRQLASGTKGSTSFAYTYNADGLRTKKVVNGVTTEYYWAGTLLSMMVVNPGTSSEKVLKFYYDAEGRPIYFDLNETIYFYVTNLQGDVVALTDSYGEVVSYQYDAWGKPITTDYISSAVYNAMYYNPLRYRGYIYDNETGFYYVSSRYYDPVVGRFLNADNDALVTATPEVPHWDKNLYAYCDNNPIMRDDDSGEFWHLVIGTAIGAVAGGVGKMVSNMLTGEDIMSGVGIAVLGGAASGLLASTGVGLVGSIVGNAAISATCNVTTQVIENNGFDNFDVTSLVVDTAIGGAAGAIGGKGFGSNHLNSAGKQLTKRTVDAVTHSSSKAAVNEIKKAGVNYVKNTATLITQGVTGGIIKPAVATVFMSTAFSYGADAYRYVYGR